MKVIADKCMQLVATFDSDYLEDCGGTENCSEDCANSIRLYLIALIHDKFLLLIQTWNRNDGMHDDVFIAKHREYWNEITKLGKDPSHNYIKLRIRSLMEVSISTKKRELLSTANDRMTKVSWTRRTFVFLSGMERQIPRDENDMYVV